MPGREREIADIAILTEFFLSDDPVLFAKEIASRLDMSRQGVHERLSQLEEEGLLHSKKPGRDRVYWLTEDARNLVIKQLRDGQS